jgi:hypothetical protein
MPAKATSQSLTVSVPENEPKKYKALEDYVPDAGDRNIELAFKEGSVLEATETNAPPGWIHCRLGTRSGLVPQTYVVEYATRDDDEDSDEDSGEHMDGSAEDHGEGGEEEAEEDDGIRICVERHEPVPGALLEILMHEKDKILLLRDQVAPEGWVRVQNLRTSDIGLVPEDRVAFPPRDDDLSEEQVELMKEKEKNAQLTAELEKVQNDLLQKFQEMRKEKELEILREKKAKEAEAMKRHEALEALETFKSVEHVALLSELEKAKKEKEEHERTALLEIQQRQARESAEEHYASSRSVFGRKRALEMAEGELSKAELEFNRIDAARARAERKLEDARRKVEECAEQLRAEEAAREANERTLMLLPGLRELMAPTQQELRSCIEAVTSAVMRNAEQSARLLASMAGANPSAGVTPVRGTPRMDSARTRQRAGARAATTRSSSPTILLNGPPLLGMMGQAFGKPTGALVNAGKQSMPERMRSAAANASNGHFAEAAPTGIKRVPEHVFKGKYRSAIAEVTTPIATRSPPMQPLRPSSREAPQPPSCQGSRAMSRVHSAQMSASGSLQRAGEVELHSQTTSPISPENELQGAGNTHPVRRFAEAGAPMISPISPENELPSQQGAGNTHAVRRFAEAGAPMSDATIERQLQLGRDLAQAQSIQLAHELRDATTRFETKQGNAKNVHQVRRLVVAPARRVQDRFENSSAQHVRRAHAAREAAAVKNQRFAASLPGAKDETDVRRAVSTKAKEFLV